MTERANVRLSFSATVKNLQIAWDSTSLGTFKSCPRKYQLSIVEGWQPKLGQSLHLRYGILYHRALEVYDHKICEGEDHETALRSSLRDLAEGCLDHWFLPVESTEDVSGWSIREDETTELVHLVRWWDPNEGLSEKKAASNAKTIPNLFRSVLWYLERFGPNDPATTITLANGKPAVELSFRFPVDYTFSSGEQLLLCGHLDRAVEFNAGIYVLDRKTTSSTIDGYSAQTFFKQFNPDNQMSLYSVAGSVVLSTAVKGVIIDAVQIAKGFSRFERGITTRTETQLDEWLRDAQYYIGQAEQMAVQNYWPMNDKSCNDYGGCIFRDICGKDPAVRSTFLQSNFGRRLWDPLSVRGDI